MVGNEKDRQGLKEVREERTRRQVGCADKTGRSSRAGS